MSKWGIFNASVLLNEHGHLPISFQNRSSHVINIQWTMFEGKSIVSFRRNYVRAILVCFCISWKCLLFKLCTGFFKAGFHMIATINANIPRPSLQKTLSDPFDCRYNIRIDTIVETELKSISAIECGNDRCRFVSRKYDRNDH